MLDAPRERLLLGLLTLVLTAVTCVAALYGFVPHDDEGLMISSGAVLASGGRLYDDVRSFYGPVFHAATALLAWAVGPTHTAFRLATALVAVLTTVGSYVLARRALPPLASAGAALAWHGFALSLLAESLHPGWFSSLLLVVMALRLDDWARLGRGRDLALAGVCCGLQGGLKPNVAVFAVLAAGAFALARCGAGARLRKGWAGVVAATLGAVVLIPLTRTAQGPGLLFWSVQLGAAVVVVMGLQPEANPRTRPARAVVLLGGGTLAGLLLWAGPALVLVDVASYAEMLVSSARFATVWWIPVSSSWGLPLASLAVALLVPVAWRVPRLHAPLRSLVATAGLLVLAWCVVAHRPAWLAVATTLAAVAAALHLSDPDAPRSGTVALLAVLGLLQHFHGFPVAGNQLLFGALFVAPLLLAVLPGSARRVDWLAALLVVMATLEGARAVTSYAAAPPLRLPGTRGVRAESAPILEELVATILAVTPPDAPLLTLPGQASLYLWSGRRSPVRHHSTHWLAIDPVRRDEIHARLEQVPWIVVTPQLMRLFWVRGSAGSAVEVAIDREYVRAVQVGPYELWRRR